MSAFPQLNTGAVAQYPSQKGTRYATDVARFVDGSEQRSRAYRGSLRRWVIRLDLVDEGELARVDEFFRAQQGSAGTFSFEDPWTGILYPECRLAEDSLECVLEGPERSRTQIVVEENRR